MTYVPWHRDGASCDRADYVLEDIPYPHFDDDPRAEHEEERAALTWAEAHAINAERRAAWRAKVFGR